MAFSNAVEIPLRVKEFANSFGQRDWTSCGRSCFQSVSISVKNEANENPCRSQKQKQKCAKSIDQAAGGVLRQINKKSLLLSE